MTARERAERAIDQLFPKWTQMDDEINIVTQAIEEAVEEAEVQVRAKGRLLTAIEVAEKKEACAKVVEEFDFNYEVTVPQIAASIRNHK